RMEVPMLPAFLTSNTFINENHEANDIVRLWCLRALVKLGGHKRFINPACLGCDDLGAFLGLEAFVDDSNFDSKQALKTLKRNHSRIEAHAASCEVPQILRENVNAVGNLVGLNETERRIIEFVVLLHAERLLDTAMDYVGDVTLAEVGMVMSALLKLPFGETQLALRNNSPLISSGLLQIDRGGLSSIRRKLDLLSDRFVDLILSGPVDPDLLLSDRIVQGRPPQLDFQNYEHLAQPVRLMEKNLERIKATRKPSVNLLLYY